MRRLWYISSAAPALIDLDMYLQAICKSSQEGNKQEQRFANLTKCMQGDGSRSKVAADSIQRDSVSKTDILKISRGERGHIRKKRGNSGKTAGILPRTRRENRQSFKNRCNSHTRVILFTT